jgi:hypothetical protein
MREAFAPKVSDYDAEEIAVRHGRPLSSAVTLCTTHSHPTKRASTVGAVSPLTTKRGS